jgi:hypothetical protein
MKSLAEHDVYKIKGRLFAEGDGTLTPDVIAVGIQQLADSSSNPVTEYNTAFRKLQARLRLRPLVDSWSDPEQGDILSSSSLATPSGAGAMTIPDIDVDLPDLPVVNISHDELPEVEQDASDGSGSDTDGASADGFEDDGLTAFERAMDKADEATLTRDSAADVALDMDGGDDDFLFSKTIYVNDGDSDSDGYVDDVNDLDYLDDY